MMTRPPIVVILGHVDHGKTTLLDFLRSSHIAAREAGGITQSVRSFQLKTNNQSLITFIDTPGHEAFTKMRQRGSGVADLAVLVIAADDGVAPQTRESLDFIKSAGIPFIVAINKIDLPTSDPDRIKTQLTEENIVVEEFGGNVPVVNISAKTGRNIPELVEMINLVYSLNPVEADALAPLSGVVLESYLNSKKGPLASIVVKNGTLKLGQAIFQTGPVGRIKSLTDFDGQPLKEALPSMPVEILGLTTILEVGSIISDKPIQNTIQPPLKLRGGAEGRGDIGPNIILRADVAGSLEAIESAISSKVNIVASGTGEFIENDILLAQTSHSQVIGFNIRINNSLAKLAETEKVTLKTFSIIYELFEYIEELAHPKSTETIVGKAQILADLKFNSDRIAGCRCTEGNITKSVNIRIERGLEIVGRSRIKSLKNGKLDVTTVKSGTEFGALFNPSVDFRVGDVIIATIG